MGDDLAAANVNRSYQLASSSIAIFTFLLFFLHPKFASGEVDALRFQATLIVMGVATFSIAFASFCYYGASLGGRIDDAERFQYSRWGDRFWLISGLTSMAQAQHLLCRFEQARQNFGEALRLALEANDLASVTIALDPLSNLEGAAGDHDRAVRLWAASEAIIAAHVPSSSRRRGRTREIPISSITSLRSK